MAPYVSRIAKTDRYFDHVNPSIGGSDTRVNIPPSGRPDELRYKRADVGARRIAFLDNIVAHHLWPTGTSDGGHHECGVTMRSRPTSHSSAAGAVVRPRTAPAYVTCFGNRGAPAAKQRHRRDGRVD